MSHVRAQIRTAVVAALDAVPGLNGIVVPSRVWAVQQSPFVVVYTQEEEAESDIIGRPSTSNRVVTVAVQIYSKAGAGQFDDEIDALCVLVEQALATVDPALFPMAKMWEYAGLRVEYSNEGEAAAGVATLDYRFTYRVMDNDPETGV